MSHHYDVVSSNFSARPLSVSFEMRLITFDRFYDAFQCTTNMSHLLHVIDYLEDLTANFESHWIATAILTVLGLVLGVCLWYIRSTVSKKKRRPKKQRIIRQKEESVDTSQDTPGSSVFVVEHGRRVRRSAR